LERVCLEASIVSDLLQEFWRAIAVGLGFAVLALVVAMLSQARANGRKFARLQSDIDRLSRKVQQLHSAEERRFIKELRAPSTKYETAVAETRPDSGDSSEENAK
jgi:hypothetical protein